MKGWAKNGRFCPPEWAQRKREFLWLRLTLQFVVTVRPCHSPSIAFGGQGPELAYHLVSEALSILERLVEAVHLLEVELQDCASDQC